MSSATLIKRLREARMQWLDLADGKQVRIIRPTEVELVLHFVKGHQISVGHDQAARYVVDWQGFSEADILGAAVGSSDPLAFDADLWAELLSDHLAWVNTVSQGLVKLVTEHQAAAAQDAKN